MICGRYIKVGRKKRTYILVLAIAVVAVSVQCSFASSKEHYFGKTPRGQKIYYTTSNVKAHNIRKYGTKLSKSNWKKFQKGTVDVAISFFQKKVGITYTVVTTALGLMQDDRVSVQYGTRFFADAQMHSIKERTFYIYEDTKHKRKRVVYTDQYGKGDLLYYVDPVGKNVHVTRIKKKCKYNITFKTRCFDSKSYIKKRCGINYNHRSKEVWNLDDQILFQTLE